MSRILLRGYCGRQWTWFRDRLCRHPCGKACRRTP